MQHENLAQTIRRGWQPAGAAAEMMDLSGEAKRLARSLAVAERWMEAAREDSGEMFARAEYARDELQEELSRVSYEIGVERRRWEAGGSSEAEKWVRAADLTDTLMEAYTILRQAPADLFRDGSPAARLEVMGALLVAVDKANAEVELAKPEPENTRA